MSLCHVGIWSKVESGSQPSSRWCRNFRSLVWGRLDERVDMPLLVDDLKRQEVIHRCEFRFWSLKEKKEIERGRRWKVCRGFYTSYLGSLRTQPH
jgi:hypothetical protein